MANGVFEKLLFREKWRGLRLIGGKMKFRTKHLEASDVQTAGYVFYKNKIVVFQGMSICIIGILDSTEYGMVFAACKYALIQ